jgi:hypothetical protein
MSDENKIIISLCVFVVVAISGILATWSCPDRLKDLGMALTLLISVGAGIIARTALEDPYFDEK